MTFCEAIIFWPNQIYWTSVCRPNEFQNAFQVLQKQSATPEDSRHPLLTHFRENPLNTKVNHARSDVDKASVTLEPSCVERYEALGQLGQDEPASG